MKLAKELKWLYCLFKCSKYLYFVKKIICVITLTVMALIALSLMSNSKSLKKGIRGMMH